MPAGEAWYIGKPNALLSSKDASSRGGFLYPMNWVSRPCHEHHPQSWLTDRLQVTLLMFFPGCQTCLQALVERELLGQWLWFLLPLIPTAFIFLDSKITSDGNYSLEIKRRLLLGRKAMTNLDSILKSRDITLLTKMRIVKAVVFPVVMYGCESWTIKKAEHQKIEALKCGDGEDS